jgi:hypothetical protein
VLLCLSAFAIGALGVGAFFIFGGHSKEDRGSQTQKSIDGVIVIKTSLLDAISQNQRGQSEGLAAGIPPGFSWCGGAYKASDRVEPPLGFTAVTAYGQVYPKLGSSPRESAKAAVEVANVQTYVHSRSDKKWVLVQDQSSTGISGAHLPADFSQRSSLELSVDQKPGSTIAISSPPPNYNSVFWPSSRGAFEERTIDGVYVRMDMRVVDSSMSYVANVGADWWRDLFAITTGQTLNNSSAGMSNWIELSTEWKTLHFTSWNAGRIKSDPPPPLQLEEPVDIKRRIAQTSTYCVP